MKFIPILPTKHLRHGRSHYLLSLAHMYKDKQYARFFTRAHLQSHYVIMDNAAYELPKPLTIQQLWELVVHYGCSELVLPDVLKDWYATGQATREAAEYLGSQPNLYRYLKQVMIVPQGENLIDWVMSLEDLQSALQTYLPMMPYTIGIAKHTHSFAGGRLKILDYLSKNQMDSSQRVFSIHLLGINENLQELRELSLAFGSLVRTIDSARPAIYAGLGHICQLGTALPEARRPKGFFETSWKETGAEMWALKRNIETYYELVKNEEDPSWAQQKYLSF